MKFWVVTGQGKAMIVGSCSGFGASKYEKGNSAETT